MQWETIDCFITFLHEKWHEVRARYRVSYRQHPESFFRVTLLFQIFVADFRPNCFGSKLVLLEYTVAMKTYFLSFWFIIKKNERPRGNAFWKEVLRICFIEHEWNILIFRYPTAYIPFSKKICCLPWKIYLVSWPFRETMSSVHDPKFCLKSSSFAREMDSTFLAFFSVVCCL